MEEEEEEEGPSSPLSSLSANTSPPPANTLTETFLVNGPVHLQSTVESCRDRYRKYPEV